MSGPATVTAAVLVIGDEILSGRTKDRNIGYIAEYLARLGVDVREARVVPDVEDEIVAALDALQKPLRLRRDDRRHRTDPRRHHRGRGRPRLRGFDRRGPARDGDHDGALSSRGPDPGAAADGAHPGRRRPHRQSDLQGPGISHRQCVRARRRALGDAGDARFRRQVDDDRRGDAGRDGRSGRGARRALRRGAGPDRRGASGRLDRLLSVVQGRALQQPDRGARQGRRRASPPRARRSSRCWSPSEATASRSEPTGFDPSQRLTPPRSA